MPNVTKTLFGFQDSLVLGQIIYNDNTLNVSKVQVVNNSNQTCYIQALEIATGIIQGLTANANSTTSKNVAGLKFVVNAEGKLEMIDTYELYCRWPG